MKYLIIFIISMLLLTSCQTNDVSKDISEKESHSEKSQLNKANPVGKYGTGITIPEKTELSDILDSPSKFEGKKVSVSGTIVDVCPRRGCWIELAGTQAYETIRVKVKDGEIVFPLSAKGNKAQIEGVVERLMLNVKQARAWKLHLAEEKGESFDTTTVTEPLTLWQIRGLGAEIEG